MKTQILRALLWNVEWARPRSTWQLWTRDRYPERVLDHIITNPQAKAAPGAMISKVTDGGVRLSDHIGISFELKAF
ncbi:MAG: hypothetical protein PF795_06175 [Kiritimatiellae bacterium]|nr:hypothetical protein [Kiritimatiellia bacterium]